MNDNLFLTGYVLFPYFYYDPSSIFKFKGLIANFQVLKRELTRD